MGRSMLVDSILPIFKVNILNDSGPMAAETVGRWLLPFQQTYGARSLASLSAHDLLAYRSLLTSKYKPSTAAAYLSAAKRLVEWAASMEYRPPISLKAVKPPRQSATPNKAWTVAEVQRLLAMARQHHRPAFLFAAIQYLGCLRPSEMVRLAARAGSWAEEGVFVPDESKTARKSGIPRHLVLCPSAMQLLTETKATWTTGQSYWTGLHRIIDVGPHRFRHSAATHLAKAGADYHAVRFLLGHYDSTTFRYLRPNWQSLRTLAEAHLSPQLPAAD